MNKLSQTLSIAILMALTLPAQAVSVLTLYQQAKQSDPVYQIANTERDAAKARLEQTRSALLPSAALASSLDKGWDKNAKDTGTNSGYKLSLDYDIYNRSRGIQIVQSDNAVEKSSANFISAEFDLILRVAERYFEVLGAVDNLVFSRASKQALHKQLEQSQQRFEVGLIAITDVQESKSGYDLAVANEIDAENLLNNAYEALREIIGEYRKDLDLLKDDISLPSPDPEDIEQWVDTALTQNPQIAAVQFDVEIARDAINLRRSGHYPIISVGASNSYSDRENPLSKQHGMDNRIDLSLLLPLDLSGNVRAQTREAQLQYTQSLDRLEQQRRLVQRNTRSAYLNVMSDISKVAAFKQALISSETAYRATLSGFDVGTRTSVDVLNSRQRLLEAQKNYALSRYTYILNSLRLKQSAGLLNEADLEALQTWFQTVNSNQSSAAIANKKMQAW
ncbi:TolC family outer membrane protein [Candidatus Venteria ishoeyi]|uniref:TolC family outer membrane protein n=1 Tax=Candidatus Venteria ishoeyi TaxID=1899563 RepID=UPI0025A500A1|nr:TolC family outer membrane protein [Candidatus Venteria ishoeyi]MDM8546395.1 TolC family outer membrane protein [Candidatus Venteria ishoeyi]